MKDDSAIAQSPKFSSRRPLRDQMKFGLLQQSIFGTADGTYSRITATEAGDSQITLSDYDAELVVHHFGENNIYVGNFRSDSSAAAKRFLLYPSGAPIELNLFYPKASKPNLKLSLGHGFNPMKDDIWFLFRKNRKLVIGAMRERMWRSLGQQDFGDEKYISVANGEPISSER